MASKPPDAQGSGHSLNQEVESTVALDWSRVRPEHITAACKLLLRGESRPRAKAKGIFVVFEGQSLPAKHVLRLAYCLANEITPESAPKFASGESTLSRLRALGFSVERLGHG
jgi:hypothetical protein